MTTPAIRKMFVSFRGVIAVVTLLGGAAAIRLLSLIDWYDGVSNRAHAAGIRRLIPWRYATIIATIPVVSAAISVAIPLLSLSAMQEFFALAVVTAFGAELYSVCLHRESYIAAYEPWWIPVDYRPLGTRPSRIADRRLQYLIRIHSIYVLALIIACAVASIGGAAGQLLILLFVLKYIPVGWLDYEAYFHWDMHTRILRMANGSRAEPTWRLVCETLLGPAVGSVPWFYSVEHIYLHHPNNGGPKDIHSPLPFCRSSPLCFVYFCMRTIWISSSVWHVARHRKISRISRVKLTIGAAAYWSVVVVAVSCAPSLAAWLIIAALYRGRNTARAQYVWHGLYSGAGDGNPKHTTMVWVHRDLFQISGGKVGQELEVKVDNWLPIDGPPAVPGRDWAFYDSYHLTHHMHPRAHFVEYSRLLSQDSEKILLAKSAIVDIREYESMFSDMLNIRMGSISDNLIAPRLSEQEVYERMRPWPEARSWVCDLASSRLGSYFEPAFGYLSTGVWTGRVVRSSRLDFLEGRL